MAAAIEDATVDLGSRPNEQAGNTSCVETTAALTYPAVGASVANVLSVCQNEFWYKGKRAAFSSNLVSSTSGVGIKIYKSTAPESPSGVDVNTTVAQQSFMGGLLPITMNTKLDTVTGL